MNDAWKMIACLAVGVVVGVIAGRLSVGDSPPPTALAPTPQAPAEAAPTPPEAPATPQNTPEKGADDCKTALAALEKKLEALSSQHEDQEDIIEGLEDRLIKTGSASREGTPLEWPEGITPESDKRSVEMVLTSIEQQCPGFITERVTIDCEEYPCTAINKSAFPPKQWHKKMKDCKPMSNLLGQMGAFTGTELDGPDDQQTPILAVQAGPPGDNKELLKYIEEHQQNRYKRFGIRASRRWSRIRAENWRPACEAGDAEACTTAGNAMNYSGDNEAGAKLLGEGCTKGSGRACNSLAWRRCKEQGKCDEEALDNAKRAAKLSPNDGRGALDTLGYVLCQMGHTSDAEAAFARSCLAGYAPNCDRRCE